MMEEPEKMRQASAFDGTLWLLDLREEAESQDPTRPENWARHMVWILSLIHI